MMRWAEELTGTNSVMAWTTARTTTWNGLTKRIPPRGHGRPRTRAAILWHPLLGSPLLGSPLLGSPLLYNPRPDHGYPLSHRRRRIHRLQLRAARSRRDRG